MAAATTIAAPLWFYADKESDSVTPGEFMKEAKARILGNTNITTDAQRISFIIGCLRGTAQHWWNTITRSQPDYNIETWDGFQACFAEEFGVPVNKAGSFDPAEVQRQKPGKLPRRYFQRVAQYFSDKLPLSRYAKENGIAERATVMSTGLVDADVIEEASRAAVAAAVRDHVKKEVEAALLELSLIHI